MYVMFRIRGESVASRHNSLIAVDVTKFPVPLTDSFST